MRAFGRRQRNLFGGLIVILLVIAGSALAYRRWSAGHVLQPIAFNHRVHIEKAQIDCSECHPYYSQGARSGLPEAEVCMVCHSDPLTKSPEEAKLREHFAQGKPVKFRKLFHLPDHVYYSHRRHVVLGKLECGKCHGDIAKRQAPPQAPLVRVSMDFCMQCHQEASVTNDCISCHR